MGETGDHFEVTCPNCGHWEIGECENDDDKNAGDQVAHEAYLEYLSKNTFNP